MKNLLLLSAAVLILSACQKQESLINKDAWNLKDEILKNINQPTFPDKKISIIDFGAVSDGKTDSRASINDAILKCSEEGGGTVVVPGGVFYVAGSIYLEDNVNLNLAEDAELKFSTDSKDYLPIVKTRWEGVDCYNYSALVFASGKKNIAITGKGLLNGQASNNNWWSWKGRTEYGWQEGIPCQNEASTNLKQMNNDEVDIENRKFGEGFYLRPNFVQLYECENILLEDFTVKDSPMWILHPVFSNNITIRGIKSIGSGPNNDGCDPESCKDVLIENCYFNNGDDCIAIKSGRNADGRKKNMPSENIVVRNCEMKDGHGGVVVGSEVSGGCKNVFVEDCIMDSPNLERAIRIKTNSFRGGVIENIFVRNVTVGEVKDAVLRINMHYDPKEGTDGKYPPTVKNVYLQNVISKKSNYALRLEGITNSKIDSVVINDCTFSGAKNENTLSNVANLFLTNVIINGEKK